MQKWREELIKSISKDTELVAGCSKKIQREELLLWRGSMLSVSLSLNCCYRTECYIESTSESERQSRFDVLEMVVADSDSMKASKNRLLLSFARRQSIWTIVSHLLWISLNFSDCLRWATSSKNRPRRALTGVYCTLPGLRPRKELMPGNDPFVGSGRKLSQLAILNLEDLSSSAQGCVSTARARTAIPMIRSSQKWELKCPSNPISAHQWQCEKSKRPLDSNTSQRIRV